MDGGKRRGQDHPVLAETVSFTEEEMLIIMLVLVGILVATVAVVGLGCLWAYKAGRGSQAALGGWLIVAALEVVALVASLPGLASGPSLLLSLPTGALAAQAGLYLTAKRRGPT